MTKLNVGLSVRLNRVDRIMKRVVSQKMDKEVKAKEVNALQRRRSKIQDQMAEAKMLQGNAKRRGETVRKVLRKYLDEEEMAAFDKYLIVLAAKINELKELDERVQLGEEQLVALNDHNAVYTISAEVK